MSRRTGRDMDGAVFAGGERYLGRDVGGDGKCVIATSFCRLFIRP